MRCDGADSYLEASSREAGAAAELAASNKMVKYAGLSSQGEFVPIVIFEPPGFSLGQKK